MSKKDCIFVNLPLFKRTWNPDGPFQGRPVDIQEDAEVISSSYAAMMKKLYATIPSIDTANNVIGGMSNGAHTIVALFELATRT